MNASDIMSFGLWVGNLFHHIEVPNKYPIVCHHVHLLQELPHLSLLQGSSGNVNVNHPNYLSLKDLQDHILCQPSSTNWKKTRPKFDWITNKEFAKNSVILDLWWIATYTSKW